MIIVVIVNRDLDLMKYNSTWEYTYTFYLPIICIPKQVYLKELHLVEVFSLKTVIYEVAL